MRNFMLAGLLILSSCMSKETEAVTVENTETPEMRLAAMGIDLPEPSSPVANYVSVVQTGNLLFLSGAGPKQTDSTTFKAR